MDVFVFLIYVVRNRPINRGLSSKRNIILLLLFFFLKLNFITIYPKRFLYFYIICFYFNPNCFQWDIGVNFHCRALFQLDDYLSDKCGAKKASDYDVPCASSISDG